MEEKEEVEQLHHSPFFRRLSPSNDSGAAPVCIPGEEKGGEGGEGKGGEGGEEKAFTLLRFQRIQAVQRED